MSYVAQPFKIIACVSCIYAENAIWQNWRRDEPKYYSATMGFLHFFHSEEDSDKNPYHLDR